MQTYTETNKNKMGSSANPSSVLLVGSIPLNSTEEVFRKVSHALPRRLYTLPDGETGVRYNYIRWQLECFPRDTIHYRLGGTERSESDPPYAIESIKPTRYDNAAIASYTEFVRLRDQGLIAEDVRFQVCLPPPFNSLQMVRPELREQLEPLYEKRFQESLARIVDTIPAADLVIQWDLCFEIMALEYDQGRETNQRFKAYFSPVRQGILDRISRLCSTIPNDMKIAFHLCYGDYDHRHFMEPADLGLLVDLANELVTTVGASHYVEWIHMPVPKNRNDTAYFQALEKLSIGQGRLYLGLVHANDEDGTLERIRAASSIYGRPFGVATECGMGRTSQSDFDSVLQILMAVTSPNSKLAMQRVEA